MRLCDIKHIHAENVEKALAQMAPVATIQRTADMFKALGDPSRLKLVMSLQSCELCVCDLSAVCGLSESAVSHQLRVLRNLGIVNYRREGKIVYYRLADIMVDRLIRQCVCNEEEEGATAPAE